MFAYILERHIVTCATSFIRSKVHYHHAVGFKSWTRKSCVQYLYLGTFASIFFLQSAKQCYTQQLNLTYTSKSLRSYFNNIKWKSLLCHYTQWSSIYESIATFVKWCLKNWNEQNLIQKNKRKNTKMDNLRRR